MLADRVRIGTPKGSKELVLYDYGAGQENWTSDGISFASDHFEVRHSADSEFQPNTGSNFIKTSRLIDFSKYNTLQITMKWVSRLNDYDIDFVARMFGKGTSIRIINPRDVITNQLYNFELNISNFTGSDNLAFEAFWEFSLMGFGYFHYDVYKVVLL